MSNQKVFIVARNDKNISGSTAADVNVLPSPGLNYRIVVSSFILTNEEAQNSVTVILQNGAQEHWRVRLAAGVSLSKDFPDGHPWKLGANRPLHIDLSAASTVGYSFQYYVEAT